MARFKLLLALITSNALLMFSCPLYAKSSSLAQSLNWVNHGVSHDALCEGHFQTPKKILTLMKRYQHQVGTRIWAAGSVIDKNNQTTLHKDVVLVQSGRVATADLAHVYRSKKTNRIVQITMIGHVHLYEQGKLVVAKKAIFHLSPQTTEVQTADVSQPDYRIHGDGSFESDQGDFTIWGQGEHGHRDKDATTTLYNATYSSCHPEKPFWQFKAHKVVLDKKNDEGRLYGAIFKLKGIPIAYSPYYSFSLDGRRKSGWLTPYYHYNTRAGIGIGWPYYWNIAPNYDLLITPYYYSKRGARIDENFRYLTEHSQGYLYASYIPNDTRFKADKADYIQQFSNNTSKQDFVNDLKRKPDWRGLFSMQNVSQFDDRWQSHLDLNYVTDPWYFQDYIRGTVTADTYTNQLLNRFDVSYLGQNWQTDFWLQAYQTLHIDGQDVGTVSNQYQQLPAIMTTAYYPDILPLIDLRADLDFSAFNYDTAFFSTPPPNQGILLDNQPPTGQRLHLRPGIIMPLYFHGGYSKPQIWLDETAYHLNHFDDNNVNRTLPIVAIDNQLYLNDHFHIGQHAFQQTWQPRIQYVYIPYKNQDNLPNFDSNILPYSYNRIFDLNTYSGEDRIQNANRFSLGLSSQLYNDSGQQLISADVAFTYYLDQPRVCLSPDCTLEKRRFSPIVTDLSYTFDPHWVGTVNYAYDPILKKTNNADINLAYIHNTQQTANIGYYFTTDANDQTSTHYLTSGAAWRLNKRLTVFGYDYWDILRKRFQTYYTGVRVDNCCWAVTVMWQRNYVANVLSNRRFDNEYFVRISFKGLGGLAGSTVEPLLKSTIPHYEYGGGF